MNPIEIIDEIQENCQSDGNEWCIDFDYLQSLRTALEALTEREAQQEARIARLELALFHVVEHIWTEEEARQVLNESPAQSLAAIKAAALRKDADESTHSMLEPSEVVSYLRREANRIEREAEGGE